jgi:hypothetical protein
MEGMEKYMNGIKGFFDKAVGPMTARKAAAIACIAIGILALGFAGYRMFRGNVSSSEFGSLMASGQSYLKEAQSLKGESLAGTISDEDFNKRGGEIELAVADINKTLHSGKFADTIEIDQHTIESVGDALEGLVAVIFNEKDQKNLNDEVLALSIIMQDMEDGKIDN